RISRHAEMLDVIVKNDINRWQERFIHDLKEVTPRSPERQQQNNVATFPKLREISRAATSRPLTAPATHLPGWR
ncbi:hypothetical protein DK39_07595, partial [Salmonella enterica subsp. enterica serovar Weltevreden]